MSEEKQSIVKSSPPGEWGKTTRDSGLDDKVFEGPGHKFQNFIPHFTITGLGGMEPQPNSY